MLKAIQILSSIFDQSCLVCHNHIASVICLKCQSNFESLVDHSCRRCAQKCDADERLEICSACHEKTWQFRRVLSAFSYEPPLREILISFKKNVSNFDPKIFANWLLPLMRQESFDLLVPVPNSLPKQLSRGFNHAELITRALSKSAGIAWSRALSKKLWVREQKNKGAQKRQMLSSRTFKCRQKLSNARIALIDDVLTTGSTADACARTLLSAGALDVCVVVVARRLKLN